MATFLGALVATGGLAVGLFGLYGIKRTHDVRPRAIRPELAPDLYIGFAGMAMVGLVWILFGAGIAGVFR